MGLMDRPPRQGSQCQFPMGTTTVGMPLEVSDAAKGSNSLLPVRNPGTMTAARMFGRLGNVPPSLRPELREGVAFRADDPR
mmetsp:Transcript_25274/g.50432  ORF Transcript_25274/g.50432 Transcript_25274/m.50432 type:complete len:81 (-) Transcript_25274:259-501(-)